MIFFFVCFIYISKAAEKIVPNLVEAVAGGNWAMVSAEARLDVRR